MRSIDRELNFNEYPKLYYPQIFVLEDGYSVFSQNYNVNIYNNLFLLNIGNVYWRIQKNER